MRKIDLIAILCLAAGGAVFFAGRPKPTATPSPALIALAPGHFSLGSCQFAGLALGATQEEALSRLGEPTQKSQGPTGANWIYQSEAGSLDLYWVDGRLQGIQCSVVVDENHAPSPSWLLAPGLGFGTTTEQLAAYFGPPAQVRKDKLETWNYATPPGEKPAELALGFERGRLLHVRMSLR